MIDPTFRCISKLFVLLFMACENYRTRDSFNKYYISLVEIKDFNALIINKRFFDQPVKPKEKRMKNLSKR